MSIRIFENVVALQAMNAGPEYYRNPWARRCLVAVAETRRECQMMRSNKNTAELIGAMLGGLR